MNPSGFFKANIKRRRKHQKGIVLVSVIAILIYLGLFSLIGVSLLTSFTSGHSNLIQNTQALAIAEAGTEWYLEQLQNDADWNNEGNQSRTFAEGDFNVGISQRSSTEVQFTSTGTVASSLSGVTIQRRVSMSAHKLSPAFLFALYQGLNPGPNLQLINNGINPTIVTGDVWSLGSVRIASPNVVQGGKVYVPNNQTVTGSGTYVAKLMDVPFLTMPVITATYYTNLIANYNAMIASDTSTSNANIVGTFNLNTDPRCTAGICNFQNFTTDTAGSVTITGNGTIVANQSITLHGTNGSLATTLTINPVGGTITFLARQNITIGSDNNNPTLTVNPGTLFYAQSSANAELIRIRGNRTTLNNPFILGGRRIIVETGAKILNQSILFLNYPGNNNNNLIDVKGGAGVTTVEGSLLSISRNSPGIRIHNGGATKADVLVRGIVYAYGSVTTGYCQIQDATVQGSVVCHRFVNNRITNAGITYHPTYLPTRPPEGFEGFVVKKPNSTDAL